MKKRLFPILLAFTLLATIASMKFIDKIVALEIWKRTSTQPFFHTYFETIPDLLPLVVAMGTMGMCCVYYALYSNNIRNIHTQFIRLAVWAVPVAYLIKLFLQYSFGRTNSRLWLKIGGPIEFRWFNPIENGGFPSGHMVVFTAFFTVIWLYYPRLRPLVVTALTLLALALLLTSYHFISDILAGLFWGVLITTSIQYVLLRDGETKS